VTVAELRELLADVPGDLPVALTTHELFPCSRDVAYTLPSATEPPHDEGRFVLFGGLPRAVLQQKRGEGE
jgi:hypothetical protein